MKSLFLHQESQPKDTRQIQSEYDNEKAADLADCRLIVAQPPADKTGRSAEADEHG
jgi:hypothetical protein